VPADFADRRRDCPTLIFAAGGSPDLDTTDRWYRLRRMARFFFGMSLTPFAGAHGLRTARGTIGLASYRYECPLAFGTRANAEAGIPTAPPTLFNATQTYGVRAVLIQLNRTCQQPHPRAPLQGLVTRLLGGAGALGVSGQVSFLRLAHTARLFRAKGSASFRSAGTRESPAAMVSRLDAPF
jgi:hypothetical protein